MSVTEVLMKFLIQTLCIVMALTAFAAPPVHAADDKPELTPGKETRIDMPGIGQDHFMLYLPKNYDEKKDWPVLVYFHGSGGKPGTQMAKNITQGEHFIIAGMGYPDKGEPSSTKAQVDNIKAVLKYIHKRTSIDEKSITLMGWSKGGWSGSAYAESSGAIWRGLILMGSGRTGSSAKAFRGKPVFIGVGENDENRPHAESAASAYQKAGAKVTVDIWEGKGHSVDARSETMRDWLISTGLLYELPAMIKAAQRNEKARKLGTAYNQYIAVSEKMPGHKTCQAAKEKADELAAQGKAMIEKTRAAINEKDWSTATRAITDLSRQFSGTTFGDQAKTLRKELTQKRQEDK